MNCRASRRSPSHWRLFWSKGAALTLMWFFSCSLLMGYIVLCNCFIGHNQYLNVGSFLVSMILIYPIVGFFADVYCSRYKVLKLSLWIVWGAGILTMITVIVGAMLPSSSSLLSTLYITNIVFFVVTLVGMGGFLVSIIQFGIDQFVDSASVELSAYISWLAWAFHLGIAVHLSTHFCFCGNYQLIPKFLVPFCLTVTLCLDFFCSHWLIKEPISSNPLKLIFKVLQYAARNKCPQQRSAFTYWDDKRFSRIDLAKSKFGGPFTTEQVEDVKTFFRMIVVIVVVSFSTSLSFKGRIMTDAVVYHYRGPNFTGKCSASREFIANCYVHLLLRYFDYLHPVVFVPLFEIAFYPLVSFFLPRLKAAITITRKLVLGIFVLLFCNLCLLLMEVFGQSGEIATEGNETVCFLTPNSVDDVLNISYFWLFVPKIFSGISFYTLLTSFLEFLCAQCPYSMKGLLLGAMYGIFGLSIAFSYALGYIAQLILKEVRGCGVWYFGVAVVENVLLLLISSCTVWWYSWRRRDENIHNEHMFAVNYYERYIRQEEEYSVSSSDDS